MFFLQILHALPRRNNDFQCPQWLEGLVVIRFVIHAFHCVFPESSSFTTTHPTTNRSILRCTTLSFWTCTFVKGNDDNPTKKYWQKSSR